MENKPKCPYYNLCGRKESEVCIKDWEIKECPRSTEYAEK